MFFEKIIAKIKAKEEGLAMISVDLSQTDLKALDQEIDGAKVKEIHEMIFNKTGVGADFLGWLD